jgi:hypothetical protein
MGPKHSKKPDYVATPIFTPVNPTRQMSHLIPHTGPEETIIFSKDQNKEVWHDEKMVSKGHDIIYICMALNRFTLSEFGLNFPKELVLYVMELYYSFFQVTIYLGEADFQKCGACTRCPTLYIVDTNTSSWIALPGKSNGYIIVSPDGNKCAPWCGSRCNSYPHTKLPDYAPNGIKIFSNNLNDPLVKKAMEGFQTWKSWREKDNIWRFESTFIAHDQLTMQQYSVEIDMNLRSNNSNNWIYKTHGGLESIPHDGKL